MRDPDLPLTHDLVLIGGGHTHALFLRKWGMRSLPGARLTLINPGPAAPYSGMLPGFVAGHYQRCDLDIDLVRLARFSGARFICGAAESIDLENRLIHLSGRTPVAYDVCSIDIGITSDMPSLPGFSEHAIAAKPLGPFAEKWEGFLNNSGRAKVAILGAGVAGAELSMAMAYALRLRGREATVTLIDKNKALSAVSPRVREKILHKMQGLGVEVVEHAAIEKVAADAVVLEDGRQIPSNFTTGAAGAKAYDWIAQTGLDVEQGFIKINAYLQSSDPAVFATGDCAHLSLSPRPKAGVYAVRQAPVLYDNICASLSGGKLRPYTAQKDYLKLVSLGEKSAIGERYGLAPHGPHIWKWKDHIDQKFMDQFRDLPVMTTPGIPAVHTIGLADAIGDKPLCGGCGAKIGRSALRHTLDVLPGNRRSDIIPLPGDDAALLMTGSVRQVITSDHLRAMVDDPVTMTHIAAIHALGDIWAMGAIPQAATATVILPRLSDTLQRRTLAEIMQTASTVLRAAGAEIVGGHSSIGSELTVGFTITGLCETDPITLAGGRPGDALILTKPLGSGVLMAAEMAGRAEGRWITTAIEQMTQSQSEAARILAGVHAMTDVTGFGLAGHLQGLCEASGTGARVSLSSIPLMAGALEMAADGVKSSLYRENRRLVAGLPDGGAADLLFDPQTAGGLLAAVDPGKADELLSELCQAGYSAARIGALTEQLNQIELCST